MNAQYIFIAWYAILCVSVAGRTVHDTDWKTDPIMMIFYSIFLSAFMFVGLWAAISGDFFV